MQNEIKWTSSKFWTLSNSVLKKNTSVIDSIAGTQENIDLSEPIHVCDEKNWYTYTFTQIYAYTCAHT